MAVTGDVQIEVTSQRKLRVQVSKSYGGGTVDFGPAAELDHEQAFVLLRQMQAAVDAMATNGAL